MRKSKKTRGAVDTWSATAVAFAFLILGLVLGGGVIAIFRPVPDTPLEYHRAMAALELADVRIDSIKEEKADAEAKLKWSESVLAAEKTARKADCDAKDAEIVRLNGRVVTLVQEKAEDRSNHIASIDAKNKEIEGQATIIREKQAAIEELIRQLGQKAPVQASAALISADDLAKLRKMCSDRLTALHDEQTAHGNTRNRLAQLERQLSGQGGAVVISNASRDFWDAFAGRPSNDPAVIALNKFAKCTEAGKFAEAAAELCCAMHDARARGQRGVFFLTFKLN